MSKAIALREAYGEALRDVGEQMGNVVVLEADVGSSSKSVLFGSRFPERYFNVGISELDMNAMAAGFAACGLIPFTNTFATFMTMRAIDPISSIICYDKMNVKLVGTYCGLSDSYDGASHHATSDIAIMRSLPHMTILSPCDPVETRKAVFAAAQYNGPVYLRISRAPAPVLMKNEADFEIGKAVTLKEGRDVSLLATGYMVHKAMEAARELDKEGICARVVNIHTIKPLDEACVLRCAKETRAIVTIEEHSVYGGLGSAVAEVLAQGCPVPVEMIGLTDYAESGDYEALLEKYGLHPAHIAASAKKALARKG